MRAGADAVLVGEGTLRADDPMLLPVGVRAGRTPLRVVAAASGRLPAAARLFASLDQGPVAVALPQGDEGPEAAALAARGVELLRLPAASGGVDPAALVDALGRRGVTSVLCEGGAGLGAALLRAGQVDRVVLFLAPRLLGDPAAHPLVGDLGCVRLDDALGFRVVRVGRSGPDVRVDLEPA
jgi:diaminohydroxyphosphoribosylaminopyrimidine deaminase/5-amino-6-(5-phosphoribosylamino)uracil reductase